MGLQDINVFYKLTEAPVYMATVAKSGCTYLKNLFYYLEYDEPHPLGNDIHQDESKLLRADESDMDAIMNSPYVYMVFRNPVSRFYSMYYEKIVNPFDEGTFWFREQIGYDLGMNFDPDLDLEGHQRNTLILVNWIEKNINKETDHFIDFHWRPQYWKHRRIKPFSPDIIPLEMINRALPIKIGEAVPDLKAAMSVVRSRNISHKPFSYDETRTWATTKRIREVYARDVKLHRQATKHWRAKLEQNEDDRDTSA